MRKLRHRRGRSVDEGAAAVEFALVVPLLLLLVFGIIQFGITFGQYLALNNAARQGGRVGVVLANTCGTVMQQVYQGAFGTIGLNFPVTSTVANSATGPVCTASISSSGAVTSWSLGSATTVACPTGVNANAAALTVTASSTRNMAIPPFFFVSNMQLTGNGVYQCEITS